MGGGENGDRQEDGDEENKGKIWNKDGEGRKLRLFNLYFTISANHDAQLVNCTVMVSTNHRIHNSTDRQIQNKKVP
jgi:hypothetical protein